MATIDRVAGGALILVALLTLALSRALPLGTLRTPGPALHARPARAPAAPARRPARGLRRPERCVVIGALARVAARRRHPRRLRLRRAGARAARLPADDGRDEERDG